MGHLIDELVTKFRNENIVGKFIYVNVAIYLVVALVSVFATLFNSLPYVVAFVRLFELPSSLNELLLQPWSLVTYMFLHGGLMHILWNMLALYGFGRIFMSFYSTRHFVGVYLLGGIAGGVFYVLAYNLLPYFSNSVGSSYLVGASASVLAVVMAAAVRNPSYRVNLFLFGTVKLITIAVATVLISLLLLASDNAGGNIAHIGGATAGWAFAYFLNKGTDLTRFLNATVDFLSNLFSRFSFKKKRVMKFKKTGKHSDDYEYNARKKEIQDDIDAILDKVKKSGYSSLSDNEKRRLFDASSGKK